jgi:predicted ATP-binding protein involved in virulence
MIIKNLHIKNIGLFKDEIMDFVSTDIQLESPPVIIITGENGTGKSVILDSIRTLFYGVFGSVEREITSGDHFLIESELLINQTNNLTLTANSRQDGKIKTNEIELNKIFRSQFDPTFTRDFIFEYWTSKLSNDNFTVDSVQALGTRNYLDDALSGIHKNVDVTKVITFFDYLKDSTNQYEKELGESLYSLLENIINISITNGKLSHVSRINLTPIINVQNNEISLDKLSSGNLFLIQRLSSLLKQVYAICVINKIPIKDYKKIRGVLLIDEAENHLHPKWQKVFLKNILALFPNLQIITTTHSPFIVSSVENSRVYVCSRQENDLKVNEETDVYSNKPVEEILMSPLFNTNNFNDEISNLLLLRKKALRENLEDEVKRIEGILFDTNPEYFNYLNIENIIKSIRK